MGSKPSEFHEDDICDVGPLTDPGESLDFPPKTIHMAHPLFKLSIMGGRITTSQVDHARFVFLITIISCWVIIPLHALVLSNISSLLSRRDLIHTITMATSASSSSTSLLSSKASAGASSSGGSIRWGIIGLGDVCQKKSGPAFWKCHGSQLAAVMRRTPGKAKEFASKVPLSENNGVPCVGYDNLQEFLNHPGGLDAVYVSTRPGTHLELCRQVVEAATTRRKDNPQIVPPALYVEKPVGRCAAETMELVRLCRQHQVPLYTAYISRAYERTQTIRRLLQDDTVIGDRVNKVSYTLIGTGGARDMDTTELPWRLDASQSGGGLIMDVGCHVLDRIDYLCGPLSSVSGEAKNKNKEKEEYNNNNIPKEGVVEDHVQLKGQIGSSAWATIPSEGAPVECTWDFAGTDARDELIFQGPKGSLKMAGMSPNGPVQVLDSNNNVLRELSFDAPEHTAQPLIQAVTDHLLLRGSSSSTPDYLSFGENAVRTQKVLDTVLSSYYGGREIGYWNRPDTWPGSK